MILLWAFVGVCLEVVTWKIGLAVVAFGFVSHGLLIWLQRKHPFASEVFIRAARGGNKAMVP